MCKTKSDKDEAHRIVSTAGCLVISNENRACVLASLNGLKEKERMVMNLRYGLDGSE